MSMENERKLLEAGWISADGHGSKQWSSPGKLSHNSRVWMSEACAMMRLTGYSKFQRAAEAPSVNPDDAEYENGNDVSYDTIKDAIAPDKGDQGITDGPGAARGPLAAILEDLKPGPIEIKEIDLPETDVNFYPGRIEIRGNRAPRNHLVDAAVRGNVKEKLVKLLDHYTKIQEMRDDLPDPHDRFVDDCLEVMIDATAVAIIQLFQYR